MQQFKQVQYIVKNIAADLSLIVRLKILVLMVLCAHVFIASEAFAYGVTPSGANIDDCTGPRGQGGIPRQTCNDLIDLPLCSVTTNPQSINPAQALVGLNIVGINCVRECSETMFENTKPAGGVRGVDYAVHGKHCIRFCGEEESGVASNSPSPKCVARKCHQLSPSNPNHDAKFATCDAVKCSLLSKGELADDFTNKLNKDEKKYCEIDKKCYEFPIDKLPYMRYRLRNSTCKMHDCAPTTCNLGVNDTLNIENQGTSYINKYKQYIDPGYGLAQGSICKPQNCLPISYRKSRCKAPEVNGFPSVVDTTLCDATSTCDRGFCTKKIDCNIASNATENECIPAPTISQQQQAIASSHPDPKSWFYRPEPLSRVKWDSVNVVGDDICYHRDDLRHNWGGKLFSDSARQGNLHIPAWGPFSVDVGYFHTIIADERSPGHCGASKTGVRGTGYIYLCGTNMNLYTEPDKKDVGYIDGYATANYELPNPEYKVKACLRYRNALRLGACGRRVCGIFCEFDVCRTQMCGWDVCRTLTVRENSPRECHDPFESDKDSDCNARMGGGESVDSYVKLRTIKFGRRLCTFLDLKGTFAHDADYMDGKEELDDGTCIDGTKDLTNEDLSLRRTECNGKNSNDNHDTAHDYRAIQMIPYISKDYEDIEGREYKEQECALIPLRKGPPKLYTIANIRNSERLFAPPLYISEVKVVKGGAKAVDQKTDFHYPEIEVTFGDQKTLLSLEKDEIGGLEQTTIPAYSEAELKAMVGAKEYVAKVFIQKEFNIITNKPVICLYRNQRDPTTQEIKKHDLACIDRREPEIDAMVGTYKRKAIVSAPSSNIFNNASLKLQLMVSAGADTVDNNCSGDDDCSPILTFDNPSTKNESCQKGIEGHDFCARKEKCSELFDDCIANEIALAALSTGDPEYETKVGIKEQCDNSLLLGCNVLWDIPPGSITTVAQLIQDMPTNSLRPNAAKDNDAYGWFNEICIVKGFEDKLLNVVAHKVKGGAIKGKCLIDETIAGVNASNCGDGGNAAENCPCQKIGTATLASLGRSDADYEVRKQTFREAGLCINVPYPRMCPEIKYTGDPITSFYNDNGDWNYPFTAYAANGTSGVHTSHRDRTQNTIAASGHGEFGATFSGANDLKGECVGFWKGQDLPSGNTAKPVMSCKIDGTWENLRDGCVRYECEARNAGDGMHENNGNKTYLGQYSLEDSDTDIANETQGLFHGYANWNKLTKTNDFLERSYATGCAPGFELDGGKTPYRDCNQHGEWTQAADICKRITCPAINPPTVPANGHTFTQAELNEWIASGGANFAQGKASKSNAVIGTDNDGNEIYKAIGETGQVVVEGECYDGTSIGSQLIFFQGASKPKRTCNHLGQWSNVENPCTTTCQDLNNPDSNNGFAYWKKVDNVPLGGTVSVRADTSRGDNGCRAGYKWNPYTLTGNDSIYAIGSALFLPPYRSCKSISNTSVSKWDEHVGNACVDYCPGADDDDRPGTGLTKHQTSSGPIEIRWNRASFNEVQYQASSSNLNASNFGNVGGDSYLLKRRCGDDGKWEDPVPVCSSDSGSIITDNAIYDKQPTVSGNDDHIEANDTVTGSCKPGYAPDGSAPIRKCKASNKINEYYLEHAQGSKACKKVCNINSGQTFHSGNLVYEGSTTSTNRIELKCQNDYVIRDFSNQSTAAYHPTYADCQDDGTWGDIWRHPDGATYGCRNARSCSIDKVSKYIDGNGSPSGIWVSVGPISDMKHNDAISVSFSDTGSLFSNGATHIWNFAAGCNDGNMEVKTENNYVNFTEHLITKEWEWSTTSKRFVTKHTRYFGVESYKYDDNRFHYYDNGQYKKASGGCESYHTATWPHRAKHSLLKVGPKDGC